ncbi:DUF5336 domain-containing protein [Streptomyces sp. 4N509B]|uniref:DUF5336 domain-containing protein n=1 Tax=Streptomyces sp. 4N509B TaxID=3457413 RepID=UPI003FD2873C
MNNRSLRRGDLVVGGAALLLFIASFLDTYSYDFEGFSDSVNGWDSSLFPVLPSLFLAGILGGGAIIGSRFLPQPERLFLGLRLDQWGIALSVTSAWAALWTMISDKGEADLGIGLIIGLLATLALAGTAIATPMVPALQQPLSSGTPGQPGVGQPYGGQPGYGYPGPGGQPQPGQPQPSYGGGQPTPQQQAAAYQPTAMAPAVGGAAGQPQQQAGADPNFQPFWFAVPAARPLYSEDGSSTPVAELAPGTWYLAVEQRGQSLVAQTQDGRRGVLQDTSGIQRG